VNNVLLLFHINLKLKGTMSFEFVIDLDPLVDKDVISHIAAMFIVCYAFNTGRYCTR